MHPARKQRLLFILALIVSVTLAMGLALYALRQNINLFLTPSQVKSAHLPPQHVFRLGGIVKKGSIVTFPHSSKILFILTDSRATMTVEYQGLLPALFREGQDIIAQGYINKEGIFVADQVLAKHDANYHPALPPALTLPKGHPTHVA